MQIINTRFVKKGSMFYEGLGSLKGECKKITGAVRDQDLQSVGQGAIVFKYGAHLFHQLFFIGTSSSDV